MIGIDSMREDPYEQLEDENRKLREQFARLEQEKKTRINMLSKELAYYKKILNEDGLQQSLEELAELKAENADVRKDAEKSHTELTELKYLVEMIKRLARHETFRRGGLFRIRYAAGITPPWGVTVFGKEYWENTLPAALKAACDAAEKD